MTFRSVDTRASFTALEERISAYWQQHDIKRKALAHGDQAKPFIFYEGPPTANGKPGIHHVEARVTKDIIIRYHRMCGQYVIGARGGWDTHGLPVEIEVEKKLGFSGKPDIERYGIAAFNAECKTSVQTYISEWERMTDRIAYWIDMEKPYSTFDNSYIESLWWILRQFWDRDLLFRDYKVTMHCPRCGTTLSDAEVNLGFEDDVDDPSVWLRFRVTPAGHALDAQLAGASFIAWTTTPWTLPANVALAVNPDADYVLAETGSDDKRETVILSASLAEKVLGEGHTILATYTGNELVGMRYTRLFDGVPGPGDTPDLSNAYRVIADEFVSLEDGTGIVHIAPAYGDLEIGRKYALPTLFSVDLNGNTMAQFADLGFANMFFKQADPVITKVLKERGDLFKSGRVKHAYPFCWRCKTPLLYYAKPSWYIRTTARKERLVATNQEIAWVPEHIKGGRFGKWVANNIDWAISRERYWGTPLPIWVSADGQHSECIGSVAELEAKVGRSLSDLDLHRPYIDEITWEDPTHGTMRRITDVADCWFDSGAMPVAQWHYPFENKELFENIAGQADYISEAIDQTRGWFYTLHAVSTLLFDRPAFQNVICLGHILDGKGEKMSKSRGNIVNPWDIIDEFGTDAVRWYMFASAPPYNPRRFSRELVGDMLRQFTLTLWNTYAFFVTYANLDGWTPAGILKADGSLSVDIATLTNPLDKWALARLDHLVRTVTQELDGYDIYAPAKAIEQFVDELSNWYVRRSRRRFWKTGNDADTHAAYTTLYTCVVTLSKLLAPFMPFIAEEMYANLVLSKAPSAPQSVHMAAWPQSVAAWRNDALVAQVDVVQTVVGLGRAARRSAALKVRQPLSTMLARVPAAMASAMPAFDGDIRDELNVKTVQWLDTSATFIDYRFKPNLRVVGKKYGKLVPALSDALKAMSADVARANAIAVEAGQSFTLVVDDQTLTIAPDEVLVETSSPEGYAVAEENGILAALDTTLSAELVAEGIAREVVRYIQDARKNAGLAIADRINVSIDGVAGDATLEATIETWKEYMCAETLAVELVLAKPLAGAHVETLELDDKTLTIAISKIA
ncbi:MAG: isoleucine--tRNA ligase [Roseiflexaceae bacterium]